MKKIAIMFLLPLSLQAYTAKQNISISYFDEETVKFHLPNPPNFIKNRGRESVEKGMMIFYERKLLDLFTIMSGYSGCTLGRWTMKGDQIYTTSAFLSCRVWAIHLPFAHTYLEYSILGPTLLSKENFNNVDFGSNILFQNFFGAGIELGEGRGFSINLKILKYTNSDVNQPDVSIHIPILVSVGYLF